MDKEQAKRILIKAKELKRAKDALSEERTDEYNFIGLRDHVDFDDVPYTNNQQIHVSEELLFDLKKAFGASIWCYKYENRSVTGYVVVDDIAFFAYTQDTTSKLWKIADEQEGEKNND